MIFDMHSNDWLLHKFEHYDQLRASDRAYYSERYGFYVLTRYADVSYALQNPSIFSSERGNLPCEQPERFGRTLGASDNPKHSYFKSIVLGAYSRENERRVCQGFMEYCDSLGGLPSDMTSLTNRLSARAIALTLGIEGLEDIVYFRLERGLLKETRAVIKDLQDRIMQGERPTNEGLYYHCLQSNCDAVTTFMLLLAPIISGSASLAAALQHLVLDAPNYDGDIIDESLRYHSSTGRFARTVTTPTKLHSVDLVPGDRVLLSLESANRDPCRFNNPNEFLPNRDNSASLAFGRGIHSCIALSFSRELLKVFQSTLRNIQYTPSFSEYIIDDERNIDMIKDLRIRINQ